MAGTSGCTGPPGQLLPADAAPVDAALPAADAPAADAPAADAAPADAPAAADAEPDADPSLANPLGIAFTDVTDTWPEPYRGGRSDPDPWGVGSGAAVGDVDGDGRLDLVLARCDVPTPAPGGGPTVLLRQVGPGADFPAFAADAALAAASAGTCAYAPALGDYDGDGDLDLFVGMRGADRLYANDGTGTFTDVTAVAGVAGPDDDITSGAMWADVNGDGLLDLYVLAHVRADPQTSATDPLIHNRLYLNRGDGTFDEVAESSGAAGFGSSQAALIGDLDGDGDLEIYVANDRFAVNGNGAVHDLQPDSWLDPIDFDDQGRPAYAERAEDFGVAGPRSSMGIAATDFDGDGIDDLYVTDWGPNHLQLWRPDDGLYALVADDWGVALRRNAKNFYNVSWAARFADFDRDGLDELVIVNGAVTDPVNCQAWSQLDYVLRRDDAAAPFVNITASTGWPAVPECPPVDDPPMGGRGLVLADLDGDGDDDLVVTPFIERFRVFRNDTPQIGRHRVRIAPRGTVAAPTPIGAVLEVERLDGVVLRRQLHAGGATLSQSETILELGLGDVPAVTSAHLRWPSGYTQRLDLLPHFAIDERLEVVEPAWLVLSARVASAADPAPVLTYRPVDESGAFVGAAASGRTVTAARSDGVAVTFTDHGDGRYTAALAHPGSARLTRVTISVDGEPVRARPTVNFR